MKNIATILVICCLFPSCILSQSIEDIYMNPKYGADSLSRIECANNLSTMSEFVKIELYDYAMPSWKKVFDECPAASRNIYLYGIRIYRYLLEKEQDPARKKELLDTLMLIYDRRIENFNNEGLVLGRKGIDLIRYDNREIETAYPYLKISVELSKIRSDEAVLVTFMQAANALFKAEKIEGQDVIDNYLLVTDILESKIKSRQNVKAETALTSVEAIFSESGAASCEDLVNIFEPKYKNEPENLDQLKKITVLLQKRNCENTDLFAQSSEDLYQLEPSSLAAYNLAKLFLKREEYEKAVQYYKEAIKREENADEKAKYNYELALIISSKYERYSESKTYALEAIHLKPDWGQPYILIGNIYAASSKICGENEFEQSAVFWAAVDKFVTAKTVDESVTAEANELINKYTRYFPNVEEAFFNGYQDGNSYEIDCWINESTIVRTRSQ